MSTTKRDLQALHYLAQRLREDTHGAGPWHDAGLTPVLARLEGQNLAIVTERVTRHAADKDARTPAAIERPFVPGPPTPGVRYPAKAGSPDECRHHPGEHADHCRACAGDRLAGDATAPRSPERSHRHADHVAAAREAMREARGRMCVHGATVCHDCERDRREEAG